MVAVVHKLLYVDIMRKNQRQTAAAVIHSVVTRSSPSSDSRDKGFSKNTYIIRTVISLRNDLRMKEHVFYNSGDKRSQACKCRRHQSKTQICKRYLL